MAHGVDDALAEGDQAERNAETAVEEEPHRRRGLGSDGTFLEDHPDGDEWADGVGDVVAAVREAAETRGKDLKIFEQLCDGWRVLAEI